MNKKSKKYIAFLIFILFFSACSTKTEELQNFTIPTPSNNSNFIPNIPTSNSDKAVFAGRVVDMSGTPISNLQLRLAEVYRSEDESSDGAYILDTAFSPGAISDENGYFVFSNIEPMEYVLVLGNPEKVYEIITDESGKAKVWETEANQVLDIGELKTDFDPTEY